MTKLIALKNIRIDGGTQSRAKMFDEPTVERYLEVLKRGDELPAVRVVFDGKDNWLWDGFNRFETYRRFGRTKIEAEISKGTQREAILLSLGANDEHGLQRSDDDKRCSVLKALADPEWSLWSNVAIAKACKVSETLVRKLRAEIPAASSSETKIVTRGGKTFEMNTGKIGKAPPTYTPRKGDRVTTPDGTGIVARVVQGIITKHGGKPTTYDVHLDAGRYQRGYLREQLTLIGEEAAEQTPEYSPTLQVRDHVMTEDGPGIVKEVLEDGKFYRVQLSGSRVHTYKPYELVKGVGGGPPTETEFVQHLTPEALIFLSEEQAATWQATYRALKSRYCVGADNPLLLAQVDGHYMAFGTDANAVVGALDTVARALARWQLLDDGFVVAFPADQVKVLQKAGMTQVFAYRTLAPDAAAMRERLYSPPVKPTRSARRPDAHEEPNDDPVDDYVPDVDEVDLEDLEGDTGASMLPSINPHEEVKPGVTREEAMRFGLPMNRAFANQTNGSGNYKLDSKRTASQNVNESKSLDSCQTPAYALDPLLPYLDKSLTVWEAACGEGLLVDALYDSDFVAVVDTDILTGKNFFEFEPDQWDILVTNPPYSIKFKWLERAYLLGKPFALLLPVEALGRGSAQALMQQYGFEIMFLDSTVNFKMPNKGWEGAGAQFPVCWLCWKVLPQQVMFGHIKDSKREFEPPEVVDEPLS